MARKEPVDDLPERKGITRAAVSCTRRIPLLDFDHGDQSAESRVPSPESGGQGFDPFRRGQGSGYRTSSFRGKDTEIRARKHPRRSDTPRP